MNDVSIMIGDVKFNFRAGLIIECNDKILVEVNPEIDFVTLPGGRIKTMESSSEGLQREIEEELKYGFQIDELKLTGHIENFFTYDDKNYHELYIVYKVKIDETHFLYNENLINQDSKKTYFKWVNKSELAESNLLPAILREWVYTDDFKHTVIR